MSTAKENLKNLKGKGLLLALLGLFVKSGKILKALKLLKFGKILVTFVSMVISAFVGNYGAGVRLCRLVARLGECSKHPCLEFLNCINTLTKTVNKVR